MCRDPTVDLLSSVLQKELQDLLASLQPEQLREIDRLLSEDLPRWMPLVGPQTEARNSQADIVFYGGSAGGGKTDLLIGLATTDHERSIIYRREATQLVGIIDRMVELVGSRKGYNGIERIWRLDNHQIELGACQHIGDEIKYQGRPHDLKGFDEITHFAESQFRFLCGWMRTDNPGVRQRVVCTGNPPTDSDGEWVTRYWAAWLDRNHPDPAQPGELRWYVMLDGKETEVTDGSIYHHNGEELEPQSRTFIPSDVNDNPYLLSTGYKRTLQALPEPLRSQMLYGDFSAGKEDNPFQVIPTLWVEQAQARWTEDGRQGQMSSIGVDVARGGADQTVIAHRYGPWVGPIQAYPGEFTPNGGTVASLVFKEIRDRAPVHVDVIGVGASVFDRLEENAIQVIGVNGSEKSYAKDQSGMLGFFNMRAEIYWKIREALDPDNGHFIALPPDPELKADLCALRWKLAAGSKIQVESKDDLISRLGRSPDKGDGCAYVMINTLKTEIYDEEFELDQSTGRSAVTGY